MPDESSEQDLGKSETKGSSKRKTGIAVAIGAGLSVVAAPLVLGAVGFTGVGIAAGSLAAKMMSAAAIANGGGVAAGSAVAVLQSAGAAGLSLATNIGLGAVGGGAGAAISSIFTGKK